MRINYVLIDFENVQPQSLEPLVDGQFKVIVFVGANQSKLPFDVVASLQQLGDRAEYVKISGNGVNALDFHIAYYMGKISAGDPSAYCHIVSGDTGFDPLIRHLKSRKILAGRVKSISDIPLVKASNCRSPEERIQMVVTRLQQLKAAKPRTVRTLTSTIASLFQKKLSEGEVAAVVQDLESRGFVSIAGTKATYTLPDSA